MVSFTDGAGKNGTERIQAGREGMTEELRGVVKAVIFKSKDESYCVFRIEEKESGTSVTVTGNIVIPYVGENVVVRGAG